MKRILFVVIAICGFTAAKSQALAANSVNTIHATLTLANVLEMQVNGDFDATDAAMSASFTSEENFEDGADLAQEGGINAGSKTVPFSYSSNRDVNVNVKAGSATFAYTGTTYGSTDNVMPCGVLTWRVVDNNTGGTASTAWTALTTSNVAAISGGEEGGDATQSFGIQLHANPGFSYIGGVYKLNVIFTASQL